MRYAELIENDASDDELFGPGAMTLGLTPQQCQAVAQTLVSCRKHFERDPEFEELEEDDPQEFDDIIRDFNRAIMAFRKNDPFSAVAALSVNPINWDLDDWAYVTHGLVLAFQLTLLKEGYAIGSVNRIISTVRTYAKLSPVISTEEKHAISSVDSLT